MALKIPVLDKLHRLAEVELLTAAAMVGQARAVEDAAVAETEALIGQRRKNLRSGLAGCSAAELAYWSDWIDKAADRRTELENVAHAARERSEAAEEVAAEALGRRRAVALLLDKARVEHRAALNKRDEQALEELLLQSPGIGAAPRQASAETRPDALRRNLRENP